MFRSLSVLARCRAEPSHEVSTINEAPRVKHSPLFQRSGSKKSITKLVAYLLPQEVYDWLGSDVIIPLYFTINRGAQVLRHDDLIATQETLNLAERVSPTTSLLFSRPSLPKANHVHKSDDGWQPMFITDCPSWRPRIWGNFQISTTQFRTVTRLYLILARTKTKWTHFSIPQ